MLKLNRLKKNKQNERKLISLHEIIENEIYMDFGIYEYCYNCENISKLLDYNKCLVFYRTNCKECTFEPQSGFLNVTLNDYHHRFTTWLKGGEYYGKSFIGRHIDVTGEFDPQINMLEDLGILLFHFIRSQNHVDRCVAVVNFCKLRGMKIHLVSTLLDIVNDLFGAQKTSISASEIEERLDSRDDVLRRLDQIRSRNKFVAQNGEEDSFGKMRAVLNSYEKMKELPIYKKLHKFFMYLLCMGLLSKFNVDFKSCKFDKFEEEALKRAHKPGFDMVHAILDTVVFVCEAGHHYFTTGSMEKFIHSGSTYETWLKTANKLKMQSKFLSNPEPHGFNRFSFVSELKDSIEKGKAIIKFTGGLDKGEKLFLQKLLMELQLIESEETTKRSAQQPRKDPFGILIHGSSHIAKSKLTEIMFKHYGKCFGLPTEDNYRYTRCPTDEYWSGFDSTQWCIVMDDIAFLSPSNGEVDPTLKELLQVKNSVPYTPPQAALEDKGRTPVKAELLIATTNTKHLNLHAYFACPFAIARRLSYVVTPTVKEEYIKSGFMIDSSKIPITEEGDYMDVWNFSVSIPEPESNVAVDNQRTRYKEIATFTDIHSFLQWYIFVAEEHDTAQRKASEAAKTMSDVSVCKSCKRVEKHCLCNSSWDHLYAKCTICQQLKNLCKCEFSEQCGLEDFNFAYKMKLALYSKIISGDMISTPQWLSNFLNKWNYAITICYFVLLAKAFWFTLGITLLIIWNTTVLSFIFPIIRFYCQYKYGYLWKYRLLFQVCGNDIDTWRLIFRLAGDKVSKISIKKNHLHRLGLLLALPITLMTLRSLWRMYVAESSFKEEMKNPPKSREEADERNLMVANSNEGVIPVPLVNEKKTFYYHDPYAVTECDISGASLCAQGDNLHKKVLANTAVFNLRFPSVGRGIFSTAVNIHGCLWMFNTHAIKAECGFLDIVMDSTEKSVSRNMKDIAFSKEDIQCIPDSDVAIIELRCLPPGKSLLQYFPLDKPLQGIYKGEYMMRDHSGLTRKLQICNIRPGMCPVFGVTGYWGIADQPTKVGDCGSLCIVQVGKSQVLFGSHTSGAPSGAVVMQHISQKMLNSVLEKFVPQVMDGCIPISAPGYERELIDLHPKSTIRFLESGVAKVYGSFAGYRPKHKSKVEPTLICDYVVQHGYKANFGPPCMDWKPWHLAIKDMTTPIHCYQNSNIKICEDAFYNDIVSKLGENLGMLQVYTLDVALNGADGITYVDKLNASTSAGNPFKRSKEAFIVQEEGKIVQVSDVILDRVKQIEKCYDSNTRFHPQFCGHLKDEPVSFKKMESGKTRVFTGGEFAWSIVVRKYLLSHIRLIQNNPFVFEAMPGVVAQSTEWQRLYDHLTFFGEDMIVAGDYGKFDKRMAAPFILSAFSILERLAKKAGWPDEDLRYIRCIAADTAFPCIDFNGDLIEIQGNPSGHPLTVIINCLVNSLYMRYAYLLISGKPIETFQENVRLVTYGDDNIMGVSKSCPGFNHTRIAAAMKLIGVEYTMAEKEAESIPYINIRDASFLKRAFRFDKDIGCIVAPLDESSFHKMLTSRLPKKDFAAEAHVICVVETAQREYFFHGKEIFEEKQLFFRKLIDDCGLSKWVKDSTFPKYYDLVYDFWMRYDDVESAMKFSLREHTPQSREHTLQSEMENTINRSQALSAERMYEQIGQTIPGSGFRVKSTCCTLRQDEVSVPNPVCSVSSSSSVDEEEIYRYETLGYHLWQAQSEETSMGTTEDSTIQEEKAQTVSFLEKANRYATGFAAHLPPASEGDATQGADLKEFLSRPVLIHSYTWNESDPVTSSVAMNPWQLFFNTTSIKNKMTNFAWLKCDLKIKVLVNASPFYYGATLLQYRPLQNYNPALVIDDTAQRNIILFSQRPHIWIYPENNEGGEMTLPFLWPKNWISTISNNDFINMGRLTFHPVVALQSANGVTGTGVTVSTYAWAENVVLSGPTSGLVMQSDEYSMKPVSSVASAVSNAAGALSGLPMIGSFMTATQIGANTVGSIASSLGFSNPPVIDNTIPVKSQGIPQLAAPEISYPIEKLTIDPKNELTVDPSAVGLPPHDELSIQHLVGKECYLCNFTWNTAHAVDDVLFSSAVTPEMFDIDTTPTAPLYLTPMAWISAMFNHWRGDIIFRFRFICSQYHRGRVRIIYDPSGSAAQNIINTAATQSVVFNEIVDLTKDTNVEVRVPYQQALAWCTTFGPVTTSQIPFNVSGFTYKHVPSVTNGMIAIRVVTSLTAPILASTINCIVSVRGAENLEFANPGDVSTRYSYFAPQSDEYEETDSVQVIAGHSPPILYPERYLINFGEQITSIRQMLRRFQWYRTILKTGAITATLTYKRINMYKLPPFYGYHNNGWDVAKGLNAPGSNFNFNYCGNTYLHWITPAFVGQRGSINYTSVQDGSKPTFQLVSRQPNNSLTVASDVDLSVAGTTSVITEYMRDTVLTSACSSGIMAGNNFTTAGISWQFPNYSSYKFNVANPGNFTAALGADDTDTQSQSIIIGSYKDTTAPVINHLFIAAGTDYMPVFFLNVPTVFVYSGNPVPV